MRSVEPLGKAAVLLKTDSETLSKCLMKRIVKYPGQTIEVEHTRDEATSVLDSLIKSIYSRLFTQIVLKLNQGISTPRKESQNPAYELPTVGLLDIFGFEAFETGKNSFEQLCINYANEKLQQQFNVHIFKLASEVYASELPGE
jgi:myosin-5